MWRLAFHQVPDFPPVGLECRSVALSAGVLQFVLRTVTLGVSRTSHTSHVTPASHNLSVRVVHSDCGAARVDVLRICGGEGISSHRVIIGTIEGDRR